MFRRSFLLLGALALPAAAHETVATEKPVVMPANTGKPNDFATLPGFQVERIFFVPKEKCGSWVSITTDPKGRLVVSDQEKKGLYRITPGQPGTDEPSKVEKLDINITAAQGLLFAFGNLYISVNGGPGSGVYRAKYDTATDTFGKVEKLKEIRGGGEHGPHALRLTPDGKSLLLVAGNFTQPPENFQHSRLPKNWGEDLLLPRNWDGNGFARGLLAPGGWVAKFDPDGKNWEMMSSGMRNTYDFALNADGEMFVYDADMEWDMGSPWYRPTRICHAISGSEFGWRSGTGKWPPYYLDSVPPVLNIGPGSPVGVDFGYGTKFPAKYQKALFMLDWTFGTIYAVHLEPSGSTYTATKDDFLSRTPLPLTDVTIGYDGALYFTTGGRNTQSELFRVTYVGKEPTDRVEYKDPRNAADRELRHKLEAYHRKADDPAKAVEFILPHLHHNDRFIRYAARIALEHQPVALWQDKVLEDPTLDGLLEGVVALARQGDKSLEPKALAALDRRIITGGPPLRGRPSTDQDRADFDRVLLNVIRAYSLVFIRMGEPEKATAAKLAQKLDFYYPSPNDFVTRELCQLLVYLKSPTVLAKSIDLLKRPTVHTPQPGMADVIGRSNQYGPAIRKMLDNAPDQQKIALVLALRNVKDGWTMDQRKVFFNTMNEAKTWTGGASYQNFLKEMEKNAFDNATDNERLAIEAAGIRKPFKLPPLPKAKGPGRDWDMDSVIALEPKLKDRSFKNGEKMFAATRCIVCHRFYGEGGATGPDLTQSAGRFSFKDMVESIVLPSKVVSDQYKASVVFTNDGKTITGKIVSDTKDGIVILTDPEDSTKVVEVKRADIDQVKPSAVSLMPEKLLQPLNEDEVLDLLAYLLSRGDPTHPMFKKEPPEPKKGRQKK
jgi:putative heme-binding domain-containing protein